MWQIDISLWIPIAPCVTFNFSLINRWPDVWNYKSCLWVFIPTGSIMAVRHESTIFWATAQPQVVKTTLILPWKWIGLVQYWDPPSSQPVIRHNPKLYRLQRQYWKGCYPLGLYPGRKQCLTIDFWQKFIQAALKIMWSSPAAQNFPWG